MHVYLQAILGQVILNFYILKRGRHALPYLWQRQVFSALILGEFALYLFGFALHNVLPHGVMRTIMVITGTWYFMAVYISLALVLIDLVRILIRIFTKKKIRQHIQPVHYRRIKSYLFAAVSVVFGIMITWGYQTVRHPIITPQRYQLDAPLGAGYDSLRIAVLTDIHISETITRPYIERMVEMVNEQHPDIVLVGGDIFDYWSHYGYRNDIPDLMQKIAAPLGVYYVMGNHDYRADIEKKKEWMTKETGGILGIDTVMYPGDAFALVMRDDADEAPNRASLSEVVSQIDSTHASLPRILLEHQPRDLELLPLNDIDAAFYGHTHNGQIYPFTLAVRGAFEISWGHLRKGKSNIYVSSGFGAAGPAIRIGTKSEIVVVDLISQTQ